MSTVLARMKNIAENVLNDMYEQEDIEELIASIDNVKTIFTKMNKKSNKYKNRYFAIKRKYEELKNNLQSRQTNE